MGRSGNIGWGISTYFGLPNRKRKLLTEEFLIDFKNELIKRDKESKKSRISFNEIDYEKETYMTFYGPIQGTYLFYEALESVCKKHNVTKAIYEYIKNMPWYDSDCFEDDIVLRMIELGIISEKENLKEEEECMEYRKNEIKYSLTYQYKGYNVVEYGYWDKNDKQWLEDLYYCDGKTPNVVIKWFD